MAFGLTLREAEEAASVGVWPDNQMSVKVFVSMMTQWRSAGFGATGLDYTALAAVMEKLLNIPIDERPAIFEDVQIMEHAALNVMRSLK